MVWMVVAMMVQVMDKTYFTVYTNGIRCGRLHFTAD